MEAKLEFKPYEFDAEKMHTYLRGFFTGAKMKQSLRALQFAREAHKDQKRKNGQPYIVHPLSMTCYATALELDDDDIFSTILLHDVVEDCSVPVESLPVNDVVKRGVKYMTIVAFPDDPDKVITKRRYFNELLESKEAVICKAIDRYMNLSDAPGALSEDAIAKNCVETQLLLIPILDQAKNKWPELANIFFALKFSLNSASRSLMMQYPEKCNFYYNAYIINDRDK